MKKKKIIKMHLKKNQTGELVAFARMSTNSEIKERFSFPDEIIEVKGNREKINRSTTKDTSKANDVNVNDLKSCYKLSLKKHAQINESYMLSTAKKWEDLEV